MIHRFTIVTVFLILASIRLSAHNIWIETDQSGKTGKEHSAKIFLGGYGENERDSVQHWFSNTREVAVWLTEPGGAKKQLATKPAGTYMEVSFTPDKEGVYTLSVSHEVADIYGSTKIQYYAATQVQVGSQKTGYNHLTAATDLHIQFTETNPSMKKPVKINLQYKDKNPEKASVSVASPAGWVKVLEVKNGSASFDPLWSGLYVIEASYVEKKEGSHNDKEYKNVRHIATYSVNIAN